MAELSRLTDSLPLRGKQLSAAVVIVLTWAAVVTPSLVQSFTAPKSRNFTSDTETASAASSLVNLALTVGLTGVLVLLVIRYLNDLPVDRRGALVVLLLPWVYQVSRDMFAGTSLRLGGLIYPLIVVVIWILRPKLQQLAVLGYLIGLTALISVLMGALDPAKGILSSTEGSIITPDKQLLPWGILIGPLTDGNPLGQFLALGLPAACYIQRRGWRYAIFLVTSFAVLWTSNRSSLAALGVGLAVSALLKVSPRGTRRLTTAAVIAGFAAVVAYLPLTTHQNDAYTNRGYIWSASLRHWENHPLVGLGSQWYSQSAKYANNIGPTAFHGHNQFVQILVLGGLINLILIGIMLIALIRVAARWAEWRGVTVPAAFLAMLLTSAALEVSMSFVHRSFLLPVTLLTITYMCFADEERLDPELSRSQPTTEKVEPVDQPTAADHDLVGATVSMPILAAASKYSTSGTFADPLDNTAAIPITRPSRPTEQTRPVKPAKPAKPTRSTGSTGSTDQTRPVRPLPPRSSVPPTDETSPVKPLPADQPAPDATAPMPVIKHTGSPPAAEPPRGPRNSKND